VRHDSEGVVGRRLSLTVAIRVRRIGLLGTAIDPSSVSLERFGVWGGGGGRGGEQRGMTAS
jgi:hypothetical protein